MPKFIYINNEVVKFIDQFTWCKLTNSLSNFHNFLHVLKFVMKKNTIFTIMRAERGALSQGRCPGAVCAGSPPCPGLPLELCTDGALTVLQLSPNCPLSVLLILWFKVHVFQLELSREVAGTFLVEWRSCRRAKNVPCQFQLRVLLWKRRLG